MHIDLLDARGSAPAERTVVYRPTVVERFNAAHPFDLILASVGQYQLEPLLPILASAAGDPDNVLFNNWWSTLVTVDASLGERYLWAFPVAGGGRDGDRLVAALLDHVVLGETPGRPQRIARTAGVFAQVIFDQYQSDAAARRIMQRHTGGTELVRIFHDVIATGHALDVCTPLLDELVPDGGRVRPRRG